MPAIGHAIHVYTERRETNAEYRRTRPKINLKGLAIGNGLFSPFHQMHYGDYLFQMGLIDSNGRREFKKYENECIDCIKKGNLECALDKFHEMITQRDSLLRKLTGYKSYRNVLRVRKEKHVSLGRYFSKKNDTRRAIHVGNNTFHNYAVGKAKSNRVKEYLKLDIMRSYTDWMTELLSHYRIMLFNGQFDIINAYPSMVNYLEHLNFTGADEYKVAKRHVWRVDKKVVGFVKHAGNLTEVLIRNAGKCVVFLQ